MRFGGPGCSGEDTSDAVRPIDDVRDEAVSEGSRDEAAERVRKESSSPELSSRARADAEALDGARLGREGSSRSANKAEILAVLDLVPLGCLLGPARFPTAKKSFMLADL